ncbi:long-chain fatty acid--CoA ligase [Micromonospora sp. NPDC005806]|uniref:acyl-CoA synthetase n=1 Tax=Micromonospora sp. NPDC005806 TaxID=3364234 RepID=UPI0036C11491
MYLTQALHRAVQQDPRRVMTICGDRVRSARESVDRVARLAAGLVALGVARGDRVALLGANSDRYHECLLAAPWADAVVMPINSRWVAAEIGFALRDAAPAVLILDEQFAPMIATLREHAPLSAVVVMGDGAAPAGAVAYERLIEEHPAMPDSRRGGDDLFGIFYTGGTTGWPKGVMLTHANLAASALGSLATGEFGTPGGRLLHAAPMFHLADLATWTAALITGGTHVIIPGFTPGAVLAAIEQHRVTDVLLVPTMIQLLVGFPDVARFDVTSLRRLIYGGSPMPEALSLRARAMFPQAGFVQAYGMTELAPVATLLLPADHDDPGLARSGGRAAPHAEVRIVDTAGAEVRRGVVGEIVARGDHVMPGYWRRPEETAACLVDGWLHTGDAGFMDERGYVFVVDRIKDMIITGDENVYSTEVERALASHPAVAMCAVIGLPDERWGERVHAVVVLRAEATATTDELRDHCRGQLAGYKIPRSVEFVDVLPVSAAGKVLKRELREQRRTDRVVPVAGADRGATP